MESDCRGKTRILLVDDDPTSLLLLDKLLSPSGYELTQASNGEEALRKIGDTGADLVITDWKMPVMDGMELCRQIRSNETSGFIYVMLITAYTSDDGVSNAFAAGVDDYLPKPFERKELLARVRAAERIINLQRDVNRRTRELHRVNAEMSVTADRLAIANEKLTRLATTDELTGLLNRREAMRRLNEQWASMVRHGGHLSCVILDIDYFKKVNDTYGHDAGDVILVEVAKSLAKSCRSGEAVCRLGGEEFLVTCPMTTEEQAWHAAERMRCEIEGQSFKVGEQHLHVTISAGVADRSPAMSSPDELLKAADQALYFAKKTGRNKVSLAKEVPSLPDINDAAGETDPQSADPAKEDNSRSESRDVASSLSQCSLTHESAGQQRPPMKVLLVADGGEDGAQLRRTLLDQGHLVTETTFSEPASIVLKKTKPDVVVVRDSVPPSVDSLDELGSEESSSSVPLYVLSDRRLGGGASDGGSVGEEGIEGATGPRDFAELLRSLMDVERRNMITPVSSGEGHGEHARSMDLILRFSRQLVVTYDLDPVLEQTLATTAELTCSGQMAVLMPDEEGEMLHVAAQFGMKDPDLENVIIPVTSGIVGRAFGSLETIIINTAEELEEHLGHEDQPLLGSAPLVVVPLASSMEAVGVLVICNRFGKAPFGALDVEYLDLLSNISATAIHNCMSGQDRDRARETIVGALATLAEYRDNDTGKHLQRVTGYSLMIAEELQKMGRDEGIIDDVFKRDLVQAVPLHDIGKVAIPDSILQKPGKLTDEEMTIMKRHTTIGGATIRSVIDRFPGTAFLQMAEEIALCHHERFDGNGYPQRLAGKDIPLSGRIIAVADVYDALTIRRVYKEAMSHERAVEIIEEGYGTHFDPDICDAFRRLKDEFRRLGEELAETPEEAAARRTPRTLPADAAVLAAGMTI